MFKIKTKIRPLSGVMSVFNTITEELILSINEEGLHCKAMDPEHISMINLYWKKENFEEFVCDEPVIFAIRTDDILKILRRFKEEFVELELTKEGEILMTLTTDTKQFQMRLIRADLLPEIPDELKMETTCVFESTIGRINDVLDDVAVVGEFMSLAVNEKKLIAFAKGDSSKFNSVLNDKVEGTGKGTYNLEYFQSAIKALYGMADRVVVALGNETPIRLQIYLTDKVVMTYFLAARTGVDE